MASEPTWVSDLAPLVIEGVKVEYDHELGKGGFGKAYEATLSNGEKAAAKQLLTDLIAPTNISRFAKECQQLRSISEKNSDYIVRFYGVFWETNHPSSSSHTEPPLLIMELMDISVTDFIIAAKRPMKRDMAEKILCDVIKGLQLLHKNHLVHRDLTPSNVLLKNVNSGVTAKISDLGVAREISGTETFLTPCPGAPQFMPPEAFRNPPDYTEKLDIYSFGVLALYMITAELQQPPPYDQPLARNDLHKVKELGLFPLIERCLATLPKFRPTADDAADFLVRQKKEKFEKPSWQELQEGLCVRGTCKNKSCITAPDHIFIKSGFVSFNLGKDSPQLKCSECNHGIDPQEFIFHQCSGQYTGKLYHSSDTPYTKFHKEPCESVTVDRCDGNWLKLIVEVVTEK